MLRFNRVAVVSATTLLSILFCTADTATAQTFSWNGRTIVNGARSKSTGHSAWNRTSTGRQTLSQPTSAQGRMRLSQPTSSQGRLRLAPSTSAQGYMRLRSPSNSSRAQSAQQERVARFLREQIQREQAERARRQQIVERLYGKPEETTVMPLNTGEPQPVMVMPLNTGEPEPVTVMAPDSNSPTPQPTTLMQFEEVTSSEKKEKEDGD
jgi:hypothetical protein